jgi:hypothetical protein
MRTIWPPIGVPERDGLNDKIKTLSRLKYGKDRNMVESEIRGRIKGIM